MKKICVLASGGDAAGMNACIEAIFNYATQLKWGVFVSPRGYDGLVKGQVIKATRENCTNISHITGFVFSSGRSKEFSESEGVAKAVNTVKKNGFDAVIVLGGNGSFMGASTLKHAGVPVIAIPATIDNDVYFTCNSLGYSSTCEAVVAMIDNLKGTMRSNNRNHIVQLMGRHCSDIALKTGIATFANIVDTSENRYSPEQVAQIFKAQNKAGASSCMMIMQERKSDNAVSEAFESATFLQQVQIAADDETIRTNTLGYLQRGATPSCRDRYLAVNYGILAVDLVRDGTLGMAIGMVDDKFHVMDIDEANAVTVKRDKGRYEILDRIGL